MSKPGVVSVEVSPPGPNQSGVHRNPIFPQQLAEIPFPNEPAINTAYAVFRRAASKYSNNPYLGHREKLDNGELGEYVWETYGKAAGDVAAIGNGLVSVCGLISQGQGHAQARVGIYSVNRPEWIKTLLAAMSQRIVAVPLYDTLGPNATSYIVDHAELTCVVCEKSKLEGIVKGKGKSGCLRTIVVFEDVSMTERNMCQQAGLRLLTLNEIKSGSAGGMGAPPTFSPTAGMPMQMMGVPMAGVPMAGVPMAGMPLMVQGANFGQPGMMPTGFSAPSPMGAQPGAGPQPNDWAYIMYTSGTTGDPKGVVLSHKNVLAPAAGLYLGTDHPRPFVNENDIYLSFLPLAHIYECNSQVTMMCAGARVGFYGGDPIKMLKEDIPRLKPTVFAAVPRIYTRMRDAIDLKMEQKGFLVKTLYKIACKKQTAKVLAGKPRGSFWDKKIFSKIQEAFGEGSIKTMASGAAPLSADLQNWVTTVFNAPVLQGYGMTENSGAAVAQNKGTKSHQGSVGGPLPCIEVKLVDTDDYKVSDVYPRTAQEFNAQFSFKGTFDSKKAGQPVQRGEVCMRGPGVTIGYFKNEKDTRETIDAQGWLHTGDIGQWNPDGSLSIIDRKKNIFKLSQGEYVAPDSIEAALQTSKYISQIFVYGNSLEPCTVAVVVPDKDTILPWAQSKGISGSLEQVCQNPQVKSMIFADMKECGVRAGVKGYESPKDITLEGRINALGQGFNIENDCLTPTLKMKRPQLQKRYQAQIDAMYQSINKPKK